MTPEQLKASIFQYAIQGKLVEQRPEEGSAEDLYQKIQEEKLKLIKKGKIKKEKPLDEIVEDEIPFEIPENWKWVRLGHCGVFERGSGIKKDETISEGLPCIRYGQLYTTFKTRFSHAVSFVSKETFEKCHKAYKNDVLMALTGENEYDIALAVTYEGDEELAIGGDMTRFFNHYMNPLYLTYVINSRHGIDCKSKMATGNIIVHISNDKLATIPIPLPPLEEQNRIVAKIEELLPYVNHYAKLNEKIDRVNTAFPEDMKKSILQYAIQGKLVEQRAEEGTAEELYHQILEDKQRLVKEGKIKKEKPLSDVNEEDLPFDIPETWKWVRVGDIGSWASGATPSRTNPKYYGGSIPWLKTGDLNDGFIDDVPEYITDEALNNTSVRLNPVGSVLMAMYGATIGKLGILSVPMTTNQACCACIVYKGVYNKYLFYYLMSQRNKYTSMAEGGAQPNISKEKIVNSLIPLPPLNEQERIVNKIEELLPYCNRLKEA